METKLITPNLKMTLRLCHLQVDLIFEFILPAIFHQQGIFVQLLFPER
jgi:hypothetical protein